MLPGGAACKFPAGGGWNLKESDVIDGLGDECGIVAIVSLDKKENIAPFIPGMLQHLQHRGELAAGMSTFGEHRTQLIDTYRNLGTVTEAFRMTDAAERERQAHRYEGHIGIGHVRYSTSGPDDRAFAQPFERHHGRKWKWFSFCFNGNLANYEEIRKSLLVKRDYHITRETDTEIIMHCLSKAVGGQRRPSLVQVFRELAGQFDGSYNIAFLDATGRLAVARDPLGIRPLVYGVKDGLFAAASESLSLFSLGIRDIRPVPPGHVVIVQNGKVQVRRFAHKTAPKYCFFEWIYFSNSGSVNDNIPVYEARGRLGERLAELEDVALDGDTVVVPVPDTAKAAADAMAHRLGVRSVEAILRNRYVGRTFIRSNRRSEAALAKYTVLPSLIRGRRVILVEDSLVRSTTMRVLLSKLKEPGGAKEVHVRSTCPPIMGPCFYGIDIPSIGELYAPQFIRQLMPEELPKRIAEKMAREIGADSLRYLPLEDVPRCVGVPSDHLCMACLDGNYPTPWGRKKFRTQRRHFHAGNDKPGYT